MSEKKRMKGQKQMGVVREGGERGRESERERERERERGRVRERGRGAGGRGVEERGERG